MKNTCGGLSFLLLSLGPWLPAWGGPSETCVGQASYYHDRFQGRPTASGEPYDKEGLTAAHRSLPFGTRLRVTRLDRQRSIVVRVNDRGPHSPSRLLDLSRKAAEELDLIRAGVMQVQIEVLNSGEDDPVLPTPVPSL